MPKKKVEIVNEVPDIKSKLLSFSYGTFMGINKYYKKTENQDAYLIETSLLDLKHCHFFAVVDGHGVNGREISLKVKKRLRILLENEMEEILLFGEERLDLIKVYP
jgi:serine/threonine protein phosphatase PrpC